MRRSVLLEVYGYVKRTYRPCPKGHEVPELSVA
jgi:hypothetical protein